MYRLTDIRFRKAEHILDKYQELLHENFEYSTGLLEKELRECWNVGYQEIKSILKDLIKKYPKYQYLALYYMQFQGHSPVMEFQSILVAHYGADRFGTDDFKAKKEEFWENFKRTVQENAKKIPKNALDTLEQEFHQDMLDTYNTARKLGYRPGYFLSMVNQQGGLQAAKQLIQLQHPSEGFHKLWELGRIDISVEAKVLLQKYHELFTEEERRICRKRLDEYGYHG